MSGGVSGAIAISRSYSSTVTRSREPTTSSSFARWMRSAAALPTTPEKNSLAQPLP